MSARTGKARVDIQPTPIVAEPPFTLAAPDRLERFAGRALVVLAGLVVGAVVAVFLGLFLDWIPIC